jgi:hypothetical protein
VPNKPGPMNGLRIRHVTTATVRITQIEKSGERQWFVFRYRKDPVHGWGIIG